MIHPPVNSRIGSRILLILLLVRGMTLLGQVPEGTAIRNIAQVSYRSTGGVSYSAETNEVKFLVSAGYQLEIQASASAAVLSPGDTLIYHIEVINTGNLVLPQFNILDTLSAELEPLFTTPESDIQGQVVKWSLANLEPGVSQSVNLQVRASPGLPAGLEVRNIVCYELEDGRKGSSDPTVISIGAASELRSSIRVNKATAELGDTLVYELRVENVGNRTSRATQLFNDLPDYTQFLSASQEVTENNGIVSWPIGDIEVGEVKLQTIQLLIASFTPLNTQIVSNIYVSNSESKSSSAEVSTLVNPWSLPINIWTEPGDYVVGDTILYRITLDNVSQWEIQNIVVRDSLPQGLKFLSASNGAEFSAPFVTWSLGSMSHHSSLTLTLETMLDTSSLLMHDITMTASVVTYNAGKTTNSHTLSLAKYPALRLDNIAPSEIEPKEILSYRLIYDNNGLAKATGVKLIDTLPAEVRFVSANHEYSYDETQHTVTFLLDDLEIGKSDTLAISTEVLPLVANGSRLINSALLNCTEGVESIATASSIVLATPELTLQTDAETVLVPGDTIHYQLQYRNIGNGIASGVVLTDTLSSMLTFIDASGSFAYEALSHTVNWDIGELLPETTAMVSMRALITKPLPLSTRVGNAARINCNEEVFAEAQISTLTRTPVLYATLTSSSSIAIPSENLTYDISLINTGDTTATTVVLRDSLPPEVNFIEASKNGQYDPDTHVIEWHLADLSPEVLLLLNLEVQVKSPLVNGTALTNKLTIRCNEGCDSEKRLDIKVAAGPFLTLAAKVALEAFPQDTLRYYISYKNLGNDRASEVQLLDSLDEQVSFHSASGPYTYDPTTRLVTWTFDDLASLDTGSVEITVITDPLFADGAEIQNRSWMYSKETVPVSAHSITTNILPMNLNLTAQPNHILGNGLATSSLLAEIFTFLGNPVPDGIPVVFSANRGLISQDNTTILTSKGSATSALISESALDEEIESVVLARTSFSETRYYEDTTRVRFARGALEGFILDYNGNPVPEIKVELQDAKTRVILTSTRSEANGYYFILFPRGGNFNLLFTFIDAQGKEFTISQNLRKTPPENGATITNTNSISGWVYDAVTGNVVVEEGIQIILKADDSNLGKVSEASFSDTAFTDSSGAYSFDNLSTGEYKMELNYHGVHSYSDGTLDIDFKSDGVFVVNANIAIRQAPFYLYKTVDQTEASIGDTLAYRIRFGSNQMNISDSISLIDYLPPGLEYLNENQGTGSGISFDYYDRITNTIHFHTLGLHAGEEHEMNLKTRINAHDPMSSGTLENKAMITNGLDSTFSTRDRRSMAKTLIIHPFLKLTKRVNRRVVETGDVLTYTVQIQNTSTLESAYDLSFVDVLPRGFSYRTSSSRWENSQYEDPQVHPATNRRAELTWLMADTLEAGQSLELKYRVICGLDAQAGARVNQVQASARTASGFQVISNLAEASVMVKQGLFSDRGLIIGKIFVDENANGRHDKSEQTLKSIELFTETGIRVTTDEFGKYSIPDISGGMHAIRVNQATLPTDLELILDSPDQLNDVRSKIMWVKAGGMTRVNFSVHRIRPESNIRGILFHDENRNFQIEESELVQSAGILTLDDSIRVGIDRTGQFVFSHVAHGSHTLRLDPLSFPTSLMLGLDTTLIKIQDFEYMIELKGNLDLVLPLVKQAAGKEDSVISTSPDSLESTLNTPDSLSGPDSTLRIGDQFDSFRFNQENRVYFDTWLEHEPNTSTDNSFEIEIEPEATESDTLMINFELPQLTMAETTGKDNKAWAFLTAAGKD